MKLGSEIDAMEKTNSIVNNQLTGNTPDRFAFIIGAMKSGTTSLFEILSQHPQICPSKIKEPDYFTSDKDKNALEDYLSLWAWRENIHSVALESSVAYTKAPSISGIPERICRAELGHYRFIYMLRDPFTRIESQIRHGLFAGWGKSLDEGIPEDAINFSSYAMQLDGYLEYFSMNNIILVTLEEFKVDPHGVLSRICEFLEIDNDFQFNDVGRTRNSGELFNASASMSRITQSNMGQFIAKKLLPAKLKNWLRSLLASLNNGKKNSSSLGRWQLTDEERSYLLNRLAVDLKRLESDFGIDIQKNWRIQSGVPGKTD